MKSLGLILLCITISSIKAPYEVDFYIRGRKVNRGYFIRHDFKTNKIIKISVHSCLSDTFHVQPERSKRKDPEKGCGALNIVETQ